jgi:glycosyltransferase involved in cell wall biosynthesis
MKKIPLDVILRTHTGSNVHTGARIVPFGKEELVIGCVSSLFNSLVEARDVADIRVTIIDDHSTDAALAFFEKTLRESGLRGEIINLVGKGNNASLKEQYRHAREHARDLIYFVEDDYLHAPSAISEMVLAQHLFSRNLGGAPVGVHPVDYPDRYLPGAIVESRIVIGEHRHFRTIESTTGTLLVTRKLFLDEWNTFLKFSDYGSGPETTEAATINSIWRERRGFIFSPIPTLAIHVGAPDVIPHFIDWREWWNRYADRAKL